MDNPTFPVFISKLLVEILAIIKPQTDPHGLLLKKPTFDDDFLLTNSSLRPPSYPVLNPINVHPYMILRRPYLANSLFEDVSFH